MTRVRQLLLGLASGSAFYSAVVPALGLGEITLHSALYQPLEAEIELLQVADLSADELAVRLAPAEVFKRSGVDRLLFLNDLRFTPLLRGGNAVIRVVSSRPVREPYLNFIVEVARPNGQLLREYSVLLDPPGSSAYRAVAAAPQVPATPVRPAAAVAPAAPQVMPVAEQGRRYRVVGGDSLWKVAARLRAAGSAASQHALMRNIQALNPRAFGNGDRNRLQAGVELLLPDAAWAAGGAPLALDAAASPAVSEQAPAPSAQPVDPQVEPIAQAQRRLDRELASQAAENARLRQSLSELQSQLQQLQVQMRDKDRQLAALQAQLAERQAPRQPLPAPGMAAAEEPRESAAVRGGGWIGAGAAALLLLAALLGLVWRRRRRAAAATPQAELAIRLDELPGVAELGGQRDVRSPFAESMLVEEAAADSWRKQPLHQAFGDQADGDEGSLGDLDQLAGSRDNLAKLNLALAYIEQGNLESACNILNEVINAGDDQQKREARELLASIA